MNKKIYLIICLAMISMPLVGMLWYHTDMTVVFLFHECGCKTVYVCHDTEHAWVEYNGGVYDPLFARVKDFNKYYNGSYKNVGLWVTDKRKI